jgi:hypothetical protein
VNVPNCGTSRSILRRLAQRAGLASTLPDVEPRVDAGSDAPTRYIPPSGWIGRARVALFTIIEEEFAAAQEVFGLRVNIGGTGYFASEADGRGVWDVVLMQATDRSNVPVGRDVSALMEDLRPQIIVLLGVAGGLCDENNQGRDGIRVGDVLIADQVSYVEFLKIVPEGALVRTYAIDHPSVSLRKSVCVPIQKTFRIDEHVMEMAPPDPGPIQNSYRCHRVRGKGHG